MFTAEWIELMLFKWFCLQMSYSCGFKVNLGYFGFKVDYMRICFSIFKPTNIPDKGAIHSRSN